VENILIISSVLLWVLLIINFLITLALVRRLSLLLEMAQGTQRADMLKAGVQAPEMTLLSLDERAVTQADYLGRDVAAIFVSPTCQSCRNIMPELEELYWRAQQSGVELLVVTLGDLSATRQYVDDIGFRAPIYGLPSGSSFADDFRIQSTPSFYLLDKNWKIIDGGRLGKNWREITTRWKESSIQPTLST
jgi:peroxiredoxin